MHAALLLFSAPLALAFAPYPRAFFGPISPTFVAARQAPNNATNTTCATGVHIIVARASTESPGPGIIGAVATQVMAAIPDSSMESVDYPATLANYTTSEALGVEGMRSLVEGYVGRCATGKVVLMGYSQGAQVIGDVLCGTSSAGFNATAPLDPTISKSIVAVIQMGDPTHVPNLPQDVGNSTKAGIFPRVNTASCDAMAPITQSFCDNDDRFCDSGTSVQVHLSYVVNDGTKAADFVIAKAGGR